MKRQGCTFSGYDVGVRSYSSHWFTKCFYVPHPVFILSTTSAVGVSNLISKLKKRVLGEMNGLSEGQRSGVLRGGGQALCSDSRSFVFVGEK